MYFDWRYWGYKIITLNSLLWRLRTRRYWRLIGKGWSQPDAMNRVYGRDEEDD